MADRGAHEPIQAIWAHMPEISAGHSHH